jgi:hypothetical protein
MDAFDRSARHQGAFARNSEELSRFDGKKGTQALAAAQGRIAHRFDKALRTVDFVDLGLGAQQPIEKAFHIYRGRIEAGDELCVDFRATGHDFSTSCR